MGTQNRQTAFGLSEKLDPINVTTDPGGAAVGVTERKDALDQTLGILDRCGVESNRVFAATMERTGDGRASIAHYDIDFGTSGTAIILGKEGEGLRKEVRNAISQGKISTVFVPMAEGTESLNAAICGSIIMFERMRQLSAIQRV